MEYSIQKKIANYRKEGYNKTEENSFCFIIERR